MNLTRQAAQRNYGSTGIFDRQIPILGWDEKERTVKLQVQDIQDPTASGISTHHTLTLTLEDINLIIGFLSKDSLSTSGPTITEGLSASHYSLLRLLLAPFITDLEALRQQIGTLETAHATQQAEQSRLQATLKHFGWRISRVTAEIDQLKSGKA